VYSTDHDAPSRPAVILNRWPRRRFDGALTTVYREYLIAIATSFDTRPASAWSVYPKEISGHEYGS
jgi:hypothetical protein